MKKIILILLLMIGTTSVAQYDISENEEDEKEKKERKITPFELKKRTYVGGGFSFLFGNLTQLYAAPIIGFDIVPTFSAGISSMYQFFRFSDGLNVFQDHSYGGGVFLRYRPWDPLLLQAEFNLYNTADFVNFSGRVNVPAFMAGGGYAGSMGDKAYYQIMIMYDFVADPNHPLPRIISKVPLYLRYGFVFYLG